MRYPLRFGETLYYFDGPQLFTAYGESGLPWIGVAVPPKGEFGYVVVPVPQPDLEAFLAGDIDLLSLMRRRLAGCWSLARLTGDRAESLDCLPVAGPIPDDYLPEPGFYSDHETRAAVGK